MQAELSGDGWGELWTRTPRTRLAAGGPPSAGFSPGRDRTGPAPDRRGGAGRLRHRPADLPPDLSAVQRTHRAAVLALLLGDPPTPAHLAATRCTLRPNGWARPTGWGCPPTPARRRGCWRSESRSVQKIPEVQILRRYTPSVRLMYEHPGRDPKTGGRAVNAGPQQGQPQSVPPPVEPRIGHRPPPQA